MGNQKQIELEARKYYGCLEARRRLQSSRPDLAQKLSEALATLKSKIQSLGGHIDIRTLNPGEEVRLVLLEDKTVVDPSICPPMDVERIMNGYLNS